MASRIKFEDNSMRVIDELNDAINAILEECGGELESQVKRNCDPYVDTGKTKNSFRHRVDDAAHIAYVGSDYDNAIWEEFGTGDYALEGNGRKGGWFYKDEKGAGHFTHGKKPRRMLWNAFNTKKDACIRIAQKKLERL